MSNQTRIIVNDEAAALMLSDDREHLLLNYECPFQPSGRACGSWCALFDQSKFQNNRGVDDYFVKLDCGTRFLKTTVIFSFVEDPDSSSSSSTEIFSSSSSSSSDSSSSSSSSSSDSSSSDSSSSDSSSSDSSSNSTEQLTSSSSSSSTEQLTSSSSSSQSDDNSSSSSIIAAITVQDNAEDIVDNGELVINS